MFCSSCQFNNRDGVRYCEQCGNPFDTPCPSCGHLGPSARNFCGNCGNAITAGAAPPSTTASGLLDQSGERRNLTVMFCDLVGSTTIAQRVDAEDMTAIIRTFTESTSNICRRYGGYVARFLGDAVLCYFGYPKAFEDSAQRGMRAALEIVNETAKLEAHPDITLHCRVGLAYGEVVTGETITTDFGSETIAIGNTPNLAARLQNLAEPDTVIVTDVIKSKTNSDFTFENAGQHLLKGYKEPHQLWQVTGHVESVHSISENHIDEIEEPFFGREDELEALVHRWELSAAGLGQLLYVGGEPGIGKSRLLSAFRSRIDIDELRVVQFNCVALEQNSALHPFVNFLHWQSGIKPADNEGRRREKLAALIGDSNADDQPIVQSLATLLGIAKPPSTTDNELTARDLKQQTFSALNQWLLSPSRHRATLMIIEDLQWADPTTLEWLAEAIQRISDRAVLLLTTGRPEFSPIWHQSDNFSAIHLQGLSADITEEIINQITGSKSFPPEVMELILSRTEGVPLFVEAFSQAILDAGKLQVIGDRYVMTDSLLAVGVPTTLQDSLMARLDRNPESRNIAQLASVIGREFLVPILESITNDKNFVGNALNNLHAIDLAAPSSEGTLNTWIFKHALIRDTAYNSILRTRRRELHGTVARTLAAIQPNLENTRPEILAYHWSEAGQPARAIPLWQRAAQRSQQLWANREAVEHYRLAIDDAGKLSDRTEHNTLLLRLHLGLGDACRAAFGSSDSRTKQAYSEAVSLCDDNSDEAHVLEAYYGAFIASFTAAELDEAQTLASRLRDVGNSFVNIGAKIAGAQAAGMHAFAVGELSSAESYLREALSYNAYPHDTAVKIQFPALSQCYLAWTLHIQGDEQNALGIIETAICHARQESPYILALTLANACYLQQFRGDISRIQSIVSELHDIAQESALPAWDAVAEFFASYAACYSDDSRANVERLTSALNLWTEDEIETPYFKALVAETLLRLNHHDDGMKLLEEAELLIEKTGERWYLPRVRSIKAAFYAHKQA